MNFANGIEGLVLLGLHNCSNDVQIGFRVLSCQWRVYLLVEPQDRRCGQCIFIVALCWGVSELDEIVDASVVVMDRCVVLQAGQCNAIEVDESSSILFMPQTGQMSRGSCIDGIEQYRTEHCTRGHNNGEVTVPIACVKLIRNLLGFCSRVAQKQCYPSEPGSLTQGDKFSTKCRIKHASRNCR